MQQPLSPVKKKSNSQSSNENSVQSIDQPQSKEQAPLQSSAQKKSKSSEIKMQEEGYKFFVKKCDINHTFNDA